MGVVLFRIAMPSAEYVARRVAAVLESRDDWRGCYGVVDDDSVRLRQLPATLH